MAFSTSWPEFSKALCARLNSQRALLIAADPALAAQVAQVVDDVCREEAGACTNAESTSPTAAEEFFHSLPGLLRAQFTTPASQRTIQNCLAVHGMLPFLALADMTNDQDEYSYVMELLPHNDGEASVSAVIDAADVRAFFGRIAEGVEPRARQGARPPRGDLFEPTHGIVMCEGRCAVTGSFGRLKRSASVAAGGHGGGAACVFFSDRCPCCPGAVMMVEALVSLIRSVGALHEAATPNKPMLFQCMACNIDENDLDPYDWPGDQTNPVVPTLVAYAAGTGKRVRFTEERSPVNVTRFLCEHCLPPAHPCAAEITREAVSIANELDADDLMRCLPESSHSYLSAQEKYRGDELSVEEMMAQFAEARRSLINIDAIVKRSLSTLRVASNSVPVPSSSSSTTNSGVICGCNAVVSSAPASTPSPSARGNGVHVNGTAHAQDDRCAEIRASGSGEVAQLTTSSASHAESTAEVCTSAAPPAAADESELNMAPRHCSPPPAAHKRPREDST